MTDDDTIAAHRVAMQLVVQMFLDGMHPLFICAELGIDRQTLRNVIRVVSQGFAQADRYSLGQFSDAEYTALSRYYDVRMVNRADLAWIVA